MARNKAKQREERWRLKRERNANKPATGGARNHRLKHGRRYNYSDQLKMIVPDDAQATRVKLALERAELIVTLSLLGAEFSVLDRFNVESDVHVQTSDVPPSIEDLANSPLYFSIQHIYMARVYESGRMSRAEAERGIVGIIFPVCSYPDQWSVSKLVQVHYLWRKPNLWLMKRSVAIYGDYKGFQHCGIQWVCEGEGWPP
jgi:hypothetical protein